MKTVAERWADILQGARVAGAHYGIPWRLLAGMCGVESGRGACLAAPNNCAGIKYHNGAWKLPGHPVVTPEWDGDEARMIDTKATFSSFPSIEACLVYMAEMMRFSTYYREVQDLVKRGGGTLEEFAAAVAPVWATDPFYKDKILKLADELADEPEVV